jgi:hypothetical protein
LNPSAHRRKLCLIEVANGYADVMHVWSEPLRLDGGISPN